MASAAEVDLAFRLLLGRSPAAAELADWIAAPVDELRDRLMATDAFRAALPLHAVRPPMGPASDIAWLVPQATAAALLDRVRARWTRLGQERPHWSVNAREEFQPQRITSNLDDFAATGQADLAILLACLARHGVAPAALPRALDFGCGVGRVTAAMAGVFAHVSGCDVSESHLTLARERCPGVGFALVQPPGFGMDAPFDLWFSLLTLQHNPPPLIALILARMFARLSPGGIAVFQLPTWRAGYAFDADTYLAKPEPADPIEIHVLPQPVVFALGHEAGCVPLEVQEDGAIWPPTACTSDRFVFRKVCPQPQLARS